MKPLPTPAAFLGHRAHTAPLARRYMTVCACAFLDGAALVETLPARQLFHGRPEGFLVKRIGAAGGYCAALDCVEVV